MNADPFAIARIIIDQMNDDDRRTFTPEAWRAGLSDHLTGDWEGADLGDVLDAIATLLAPPAPARFRPLDKWLGWYPGLADEWSLVEIVGPYEAGNPRTEVVVRSVKTGETMAMFRKHLHTEPVA